ncbi:hypothetical protein BH23PLA1_BH23PLA1_35920 [soil metagenome]
MLPQITSPMVFFGIAALYVGYVVITILFTRKNRRKRAQQQEREL